MPPDIEDNIKFNRLWLFLLQPDSKLKKKLKAI